MLLQLRNLFIASLFLSTYSLSQAQDINTAPLEWGTTYRSTPEKVNDLVHTKLDIRFNYEKSHAYGKVWITLKPHFYPTDSLLLDAKGMEIQKVQVVKGNGSMPLPYRYDGMLLSIRLDRIYQKNETYRVYIEYTAKPNEYTGKGSAAITDAKGLYFINPLGQEKDKPTQIWTQGETEGTSVWLPTIDKPNQKSTQEFILTVPDKYVSLSNGIRVAQKKNSDGTRTDTWKMELPNAPYLFFIGVGDYAVIKDTYKGKEVSYYVEKEFESVARRIFGNTPEMMGVFSRLTGVDYPWVKYAQITGQDYVSGAMENTTATLHSSSAQQDARELKDGNAWESVIAHELFHHWFGDYVTSESWSNLTLNESFANYSEILWYEHKYGKDAADAHNYNEMNGYINSGSSQKDLVRYYYADREDMFDAVSYNKGGRILHMLRNFVGDSAFFASLHLYLTTNALKSAEADQLRLAFEEVTGKDLHWFFNQWYFGSGHPQLAIYHDYNDSSKMVQVNIRQTQEGNKVFQLPLAIDIYEGKEKKRYQVWATQRSDTFRFSCNKMPDLVNVDADKVLLAEKKDHKNLPQFYHQYLFAGNYLDRREAIEFAALQQSESMARELLKKGLQDPYKGIRNLSLNKLDLENDSLRIAMEPLIEEIAKKEKDPVTRATALSQLASFQQEKYLPLFREAVYDSSYSVAGASLEGLFALNEKEAMEFIKKTSGQKTKGKLLEVTVSILMRTGNPDDFSTIADIYGAMGISQSKFDLTQPFCQLIARIQDTEKVKKGVDLIIAFRDAIPAQFGIGPAINSLLEMIVRKKEEMKKTAIDKSVYQLQIDHIRKAIGK